jgi:hypothetical protein
VYLLVYVWFADDVMVSVFILEHQMVEWLVKSELGCGKKWSWSNLRYYSGYLPGGTQ